MARDNDLGTFKIPYEGYMHNGQGVRLLTGLASDQNAFNVCEFTEIEKSIGKLEQNHEVSKTETEYTKTQEANLEGEGNKSSLKIGGSLDIMIKQTINTKSIICTSKAYIKTGSKKYNLAEVQLSEEAKATLRESPEEFINLYGTHFIGGFDLGAVFSAVTVIETNSTKDKTTIGAKLDGSYERISETGKESGSGSGKYGLDTEISSLISSLKGRIYAVGIEVTANFKDLDVLAEEFANFSKNAAASSTQIASYCYPYTMLPEVTKILSETGREGTFTPPIKHSLIDAICREARATRRAISRIAAMDDLADGIPEAQNVSRKYRIKLEQEMDFYRGLSLGQLSKPSEELNQKIGIASGYEDISSKSSEYYQAWVKEFKEAYEGVI